MKGVGGIVHTASPVRLDDLDDLDPQGISYIVSKTKTVTHLKKTELIKPALNGTISILQSAVNNGFD